ncbi:hypothetical protein AB0F77_20940 [Streptomyces sp. NPDC026672]|uniref:hypothetical protein n=1 Tax=unclassified Streptomyces TaxID=2593676 RepID=UPI0033D68F94
MAAREQRAEEGTEPSRAAGMVVLTVLGGAGVGAVFAVDEAAGVLTVVAVGAVALWRSARHVSDSSATPPPAPEPPSGDVYAVENTRVREVRRTPGEGYLIFPEIEHVTDPGPGGEVSEP